VPQLCLPSRCVTALAPSHSTAWHEGFNPQSMKICNRGRESIEMVRGGARSRYIDHEAPQVDIAIQVDVEDIKGHQNQPGPDFAGL